MLPDINTLPPDPYDALADLFLGELGRVAAQDAALGIAPRSHALHRPRQPDASGPGPAANVQAAHSPLPPGSPPRLTLVDPLADEFAAQSIDTPPHATSTHAAPAHPARPAPLADVHAELHEGHHPGAAPAPVEEPIVELLLMGHLPVMSSAWASQYARNAVTTRGKPVGLVRLAQGQIRVDLYAPAPDQGQSQTITPQDRCRALEPALNALLHQCDRVIVHADAGEELRLASSPVVDRVTLLCAADESAIVAAYSTLKSLTAAAQPHQGGPDEAPLRVAIMGAPEQRAQYAWKRLQSATETYLGTPIQSAGFIGRIEGGRPSHTLFLGASTLAPADLLALLAAPTTPAGTQAGNPRVQSDEPRRELFTTASHPALRHEPVQVFHESDDDEADLALDAPAPVSPNAPASLAEMVEGLQSLAARCPAAEQVELALDSAGRLHLLASAQGAGAEEDRVLVQRLTAAAGWALVNRRVLQLTLPAGATPITGEAPVMHLFTPRPAECRELLDSPVRVHALVHIRPTMRARWVATALN
jgi:hypothetical protein